MILGSITLLPHAFRSTYENTIQKMLKKLEEAKTVDALFHRLNPLFTFIDYELVDLLISKFGSKSLQQNMSSYVCGLKLFKRRATIGDIIYNWSGHRLKEEDKYFKRLEIKFDHNPKTYTLERLDNFRMMMGYRMRLSSFISGSILKYVKPAMSFYAVWLIPIDIVPDVIEAAKNVDSYFYVNEGVVMVSLDGKSLMRSHSSPKSTRKSLQSLSLPPSLAGGRPALHHSRSPSQWHSCPTLFVPRSSPSFSETQLEQLKFSPPPSPMKFSPPPFTTKFSPPPSPTNFSPGNNEKVPTGIAVVIRKEVERRKNHIDEIDSKHPLQNLALECLEDKSKNRPSAQELCKHLGELKELQEYAESKEGTCDGVARSRSHSSGGATCDVGINTEKDERLVELEAKLESQREQLARQDEEMKKSKETVDEKEERLKEMVNLIEKKDEMIVELKLTNNLQQETIKHLRQEVETVRCVVGEKDQFMAERERKVTGIQQQLNACTAEKEGLEKQIHELHQTLEHKDIVNLHLYSKKDSKKAPRTMYRSNDAVVNGSTVYLRPAQLQDIYRYNQASGWSKFAVCPFKSSPLAIVRGFLTTVGGSLNNNCVNQLCSLTENESRNKRTWTEVFPPMPTKRSNTSTLCTGSHLIVAGGKGERKEVLTTIEVLNIETRLWSVAANLWEPCWYSSMTVLDGHLYVVGGVNSSGQQTDTIYVCSLEALLQSLCPPLESETACSGSTSPPNGQNEISPTRQIGTSTRRHNAVDWNRLRDLPVTQSTCVLFQGRLLAISGKTSSAELPTRDIYVYSPVIDSWEVVGHVTIGRFACFAAVLPDNQLMIAGGYTDSQNAHDSVEFAINV